MVFLRSIKHIWCNGFPDIYALLEEGGGQTAMGICALCYICYIFQVWCSSSQGIYAQLTGAVGSICHGYICIVLCMKCIWCNGFPEIHAQLTGGGVNLPWVYMHCAMYETYLV